MKSGTWHRMKILVYVGNFLFVLSFDLFKISSLCEMNITEFESPCTRKTFFNNKHCTWTHFSDPKILTNYKIAQWLILIFILLCLFCSDLRTIKPNCFFGYKPNSWKNIAREGHIGLTNLPIQGRVNLNGWNSPRSHGKGRKLYRLFQI